MELFDLTTLVALRIFFKTDAIILVDDANNFVSDKTNKRQLKFGMQIFNERSTERCPHKGVLFDEIDTNCCIVNSLSINLT